MSEPKQPDPQLKLIENHIKGLIFNQKSTTESPSTQIAPDINYNMSNFRYRKPFLASNEISPLDPPLSTLPLDCSLSNQSSSSTLIDVNVLTNFASKHASISEISNAPVPRVLPHPDLEDGISPNPGTNASKGVLLGFNVSQEMKSQPSNAGRFEDVRNADKNATRKEYLNGAEIDKKKKKKAKKKIEKDKAFRKENRTQGNVEPVKQSTPKRELHKQGAVNVNKQHASKEAPKTPERKKEVPQRGFDVNQLFRAPMPSGQLEYNLTLGKDGYRFLCTICSYEAKQRDYIHNHMNSESHRQQKKQIQADRLLAFLPNPLPAQAEAITRLLTNLHAEIGLQEDHLLLRKNVESRLVKFVETHLTECGLEMIGSSATGLGWKSSKVDFAFRVEKEKNIPDSLEFLFDKLRSDPAYTNVESVFKKKRLGILFTDKESGLDCNLVLDNVSEKFSKLFLMYAELDPRLRVLASCFRYWANICLIDNPDCGTLPPYTFSILLVYFLQQTEPPVLPVLHENKAYCHLDFFEKYIKAKVWKSENTCSVGELWVQLFHFYNFIYEMGKHVVCVRSSDKVQCSERNWSTKFYAIEDPFSRRNIAHVIPNFAVAQFIQKCFLKTYRHFAYPRIKNGEIQLLKNEEFEHHLQNYLSLSNDIVQEISDDSIASDNEDSSLPDESNFLQDFEDQDPDLSIDEVLSTVKQMSLDESKDGEDLEDSTDQTDSSLLQSSEKVDSPKKELKKKEKSLKIEGRLKVQATCSWDVANHHNISADSFDYGMDPSSFKDRKDVPSSCRNCKGSGHLTKNCPNDLLPPKAELPPMTPEYKRTVNKVLHYIRDKHCAIDSDKDPVMKTMKEIEAHIQKLFPEARLCMFGSFCNGFGFKTRSDMDFCLTFKDHESRKELDCTDVIQKLAKHLQDYPKLENIVPVTSAKVPIVKFVCTESGLEGDISLYNTLALANTEMIHLYSRMDPRVQILGFALKYFAKVLGIGDASRGSLSSYAYILMAIYFLQQREPPVIPVLQELHGGEKPSQLVEDWNVWYFKDLDKVPEIWPGFGKNFESVADLWLGLLSFYAYDFDWEEYVVSIRQKAPLTRFRKLWMTDNIAIEDPFDLSHNLGAGLSRKMNMYILRTFVRARERFGTPVESGDLLDLSGREVVFLFDRRFLNSGVEPPHDRGCRKCGKIGHLAKNCPQERLCSFCHKPGHLLRTCPKRKGKIKPKHTDRDSYIMEAKNNIEVQNLQAHSLRPHGGDIQRTNSQPHPLMPKDGDMTRKLLQMGYPAHRHPVPVFAKGPPPFGGPPPGFKSMHQKSTSFRFPTPFPRTMPANNLSKSPPKHFSGSPPKNYMGGNMYHPEPPMPNMGIRPELHMPPSDPMFNRMWQNHLPSRMGQHFPDRRKRTN